MQYVHVLVWGKNNSSLFAYHVGGFLVWFVVLVFFFHCSII